MKKKIYRFILLLASLATLLSCSSNKNIINEAVSRKNNPSNNLALYLSTNSCVSGDIIIPTVTYNDNNLIISQCTLTSSNVDIAYINEDNSITALKYGKSVITATYNNLSASMTLNVNGTISLILEKSACYVGDYINYTVHIEPQELAIQGYQITSEDDNYASLSDDKILANAISDGVSIYATANGDGSKCGATLKILDKDAVTYSVKKINMSLESYELEVGSSTLANVNVLPKYASLLGYTLTTDQSDIVKIEGDKITGLKAGNAIIHARPVDPTYKGGDAIVTIKVIASEEEPILRINGKTHLSCAVNEKIYLPEITALINDVDASDRLTFNDGSLEKDNVYSDENGFYFISSLAGEHPVNVTLENRSGSFKEVTIYIDVTPTREETFMTSGSNRIYDLKNSGLYKENFEDGYNAPFMDNVNTSVGYSIVGDANAISGNSLVLDFAVIDGGEEYVIKFASLSEALYSEIRCDYYFKFDWKIIEKQPGCDMENIYIGLENLDDSYHSDEKFIDDTSADVGSTGTFTLPVEDYCVKKGQLATIKFFSNNQNNTPCKIAIDNLEVRKLANDSPSYKRHFVSYRDAAIDGGYTVSWDDLYGSEFSEKYKIYATSGLNSNIKNQMSESTYFGSNCCQLYGSGSHWFLDAYAFLLAAASNKTLNLEFDYYAENDTDFNIVAAERSTGVYRGLFNMEVTSPYSEAENIKHVVANIVVPEKTDQINFHIGKIKQKTPIVSISNTNSSFSIYLSNIHIYYSDVSSSSYTPSKEELNNGYTYNYSYDNLLYAGLDSFITLKNYVTSLSSDIANMLINHSDLYTGNAFFIHNERLSINKGEHLLEGLNASNLTMNKTCTLSFAIAEDETSYLSSKLNNLYLNLKTDIEDLQIVNLTSGENINAEDFKINKNIEDNGTFYQYEISFIIPAHCLGINLYSLNPDLYICLSDLSIRVS